MPCDFLVIICTMPLFNYQTSGGCFMDYAAKIVSSVLILVGCTITQATLFQCHSPQYVLLGEEGLIDCSFPSLFTGIIWYDSLNTSEALVISIQRQGRGTLRKSGDAYDSGRYDIFMNGSLIIPFVTTHHDNTFKVLLVDKDSVISEKNIDVITIVLSNQTIPYVNLCGTENLCVENAVENVFLCTYHHARPSVPLLWYFRSEGQTEVLDSQTIRETDGQYTFTSISTVNISYWKATPLSVLTCEASGPALNFKQVQTHVVVYNTGKKDTPNTDAAILQRIVEINTRLEIPCTDVRAPRAFVWTFERHNLSHVLAVGVNSEIRLFSTLNNTFDATPDGGLIFWHANHSLEGLFTCTFLERNVSSRSKAYVKVVAKAGDPDFPPTSMSIVMLLILIFTALCLIIAVYHWKRLHHIWRSMLGFKDPTDGISACTELDLDDIDPIAVCRKVADALLNWPFIFERYEPIFSTEAIELLRSTSKEAIENKSANNKAAIAGAVTGIAGGTAAVVGTILIPFTLGASISLIAAGTACSITGASVSAGYSFDRAFKDRKRLKGVQSSFENYVNIQKDLSKSIALIANAYKIIELLQEKKNGNIKKILDTTVNEMKELLKTVRTVQEDTNDTAEENIRNLKKYSEKLVAILLNAMDQSEDIPVNIVEERRQDFKRANECAFDLIPEAVSKLLNYGDINTKTFTFCVFIRELYNPDFIWNTKDEVPVASNVANFAFQGAAAVLEVTAQAANVGDDVAKVGINIAHIVQGVAVAGLVLSFLGIMVDVAFLGKAIYDIKGDKTEKFPKALNDTADMMEKINKIIRHGAEISNKPG